MLDIDKFLEKENFKKRATILFSHSEYREDTFVLTNFIFGFLQKYAEDNIKLKYNIYFILKKIKFNTKIKKLYKKIKEEFDYNLIEVEFKKILNDFINFNNKE